MSAASMGQPASAGYFLPDRVRTIRLYGWLGAKFGRVHRFVCNDTGGAIRALCQMIPGFQAALYESQDSGIGYACFIGRQNITEQGISFPVGHDDIRIAPVIQGSGRGGAFQIILGAVLVAAAFFTGGATLAASGAIAFSGVAGQMAFMLGVGMVLGGVTQLLTKQQAGLSGVDSPDNGASYNFNGPVNVTAQGNPVPVFYGEMTIGSVTVSGDMYSEDQQ